MKRLVLMTVSIVAAIAVAGCTPNSKSPEAIRQDTASVTSAATQDAKAVVQGVQDGLHEAHPLNINSASQDDLQTLPGIDAAAAGKIISHRPYTAPIGMVEQHAISRAEYDRIAGKVEAR